MLRLNISFKTRCKLIRIRIVLHLHDYEFAERAITLVHCLVHRPSLTIPLGARFVGRRACMQIDERMDKADRRHTMCYGMRVRQPPPTTAHKILRCARGRKQAVLTLLRRSLSLCVPVIPAFN